MDKRLEPKLWTDASAPSEGQDRCVVLVLHGGKVASHASSRPWHLSGLRMRQFTWALRRAGRSEGIVVQQLQYRYRGWNGVERSPVRDARWALIRIHREYPGVRVVVVGHSMGGRVAAAIADDPLVDGLVALAPWWPDGGELAGIGVCQRIRVLHGVSDSWTDASKARTEVVHAVGRGVDAEFVDMPGGHFMIRRSHMWVRTVKSAVLAMALNESSHYVGSRRAGIEK
ncbi:alpha/beta fold hydrolase [Rhodococcus sp. H29-C3]|uniref:alpha/beta hydrolase n=1 Tax=Rhodococcus sp. H29-C3 TaxID=3046307 RepID=UPI0024BA6667|nr:alpha/beta fold hydrolase [Rhodococcus sp. H29-C3]MDJ0361189.1 alpha/beta fold hydrolase [Rhodococcus sp. H29-C3]